MIKKSAFKSPDALRARFTEQTEIAKPLLFNMGAAVLASQPERQWDLLIGDDTSGRLVTRFTRKVLAAQGIQPPVVYVCSSLETRRRISPERYVEYLGRAASQHDNPPRTLFVTENLGTGSTAKRMSELLAQMFPEVDFAFLASRQPDPDIVAARVYMGGSGKEAHDVIVDTFEDAFGAKQTPLAKMPSSLKVLAAKILPLGRPSTSYPYTNLIPGTDQPTARLATDVAYRAVARSCYERMDELAAEFTSRYDELGIASIPPPDGVTAVSQLSI